MSGIGRWPLVGSLLVGLMRFRLEIEYRRRPQYKCRPRMIGNCPPSSTSALPARVYELDGVSGSGGGPSSARFWRPRMISNCPTPSTSALSARVYELDGPVFTSLMGCADRMVVPRQLAFGVVLETLAPTTRTPLPPQCERGDDFKLSAVANASLTCVCAVLRGIQALLLDAPDSIRLSAHSPRLNLLLYQDSAFCSKRSSIGCTKKRRNYKVEKERQARESARSSEASLNKATVTLVGGRQCRGAMEDDRRGRDDEWSVSSTLVQRAVSSRTPMRVVIDDAAVGVYLLWIPATPATSCSSLRISNWRSCCRKRLIVDSPFCYAVEVVDPSYLQRYFLDRVSWEGTLRYSASLAWLAPSMAVIFVILPVLAARSSYLWLRMGVHGRRERQEYLSPEPDALQRPASPSRLLPASASLSQGTDYHLASRSRARRFFSRTPRRYVQFSAPGPSYDITSGRDSGAAPLASRAVQAGTAQRVTTVPPALLCLLGAFILASCRRSGAVPLHFNFGVPCIVADVCLSALHLSLHSNPAFWLDVMYPHALGGGRYTGERKENAVDRMRAGDGSEASSNDVFPGVSWHSLAAESVAELLTVEKGTTDGPGDERRGQSRSGGVIDDVSTGGVLITVYFRSTPFTASFSSLRTSIWSLRIVRNRSREAEVIAVMAGCTAVLRLKQIISPSSSPRTGDISRRDHDPFATYPVAPAFYFKIKGALVGVVVLGLFLAGEDLKCPFSEDKGAIAFVFVYIVAHPGSMPSSLTCSSGTGGQPPYDLYDPYDSPPTPRRVYMACQYCRARKIRCGARLYEKIRVTQICISRAETVMSARRADRGHPILVYPNYSPASSADIRRGLDTLNGVYCTGILAT
ncbi:hypothetical protein B0H11DRAFT_1912385 [Mycena galericulata]|nr:hypothetical protein B0H11DRAFT_1912385 [Mycena galericulata]